MDKPGEQIYRVFLSFRGEDTRMGFISHLNAALWSAGFPTFVDDVLDRGKEISSSLLQRIKSSRISIVVFSPSYADSRWCMEELATIVERLKLEGHRILPVFYHVDPSDVRQQKGRFGKSFGRLISRASTTQDMVINWRSNLRIAANMSGWTVDKRDKESLKIADIVNHISLDQDNKEDMVDLFVAHYPVGITPRAKEFISRLPNVTRLEDVLIAGLWGMGGIGKTSLACAIFNELGKKFKRRSFIANVREAWEQGNGHNLQEQLVSDILQEASLKISNINRGKTIMKKRLRYISALVVLDDVNDMDQLKALCGNRNWFGPSSIIIITTRDVGLLNYIEADYIHKMAEMNSSESFKLFSWHAFKQPSPIPDFVELSSNILAYCGGLPLALEVLGSYLYKRPKLQWEDVLSKLKKIPNQEIHEKLKISFDGLSDHMEKDIFLDICCFFIGKKRDNVTVILNGCGLHAEIGIPVLMERSLVRVDQNNKLRMHDLLRDMGREIIRKESPEKQGKRSRLWFHDDVIDVLRRKTGTDEVKGLALRLTRTTKICLPTKGFKKMNRLRLLQLSHVELSGNCDDLFEGLKWLCWQGFPSRFPSQNFYKGSLVGIDLRHSNLELFWKVPQFLHELKILNLSHSRYLKRTPDFSYMPNLERLMLKDCPSLSEVHETIGNLNNLRLVNLKGCECLGYLPRSFYKLRALENLILSGCSKIDKLEEDIEQMESLTTLVADETAITKVPYSIVRLKSIKYISLCGYEGLSHEVFPSLISSWMSPLNYHPSLSQAFGYTPYQPSVDVQSNVLATKCLEMETSTSTSQISDKEASELSVSHNQSPSSSRSGNFLSSLMMEMGKCKILQGLTAKQSADSSFPGDKHPEWPRFSYEGQRVSFKMPHIGRTLEGMILYIDYSCAQNDMASPFPFSVLIHNNTKGVIKFFKRDAETITDEEEQWQDIAANLEAGDEVDITVVFGHRFNVKKTTVYLVYGDTIEGQHLSTPDRDAVVSCEELKNKCQTLVEINSANGQLDDNAKEDYILSTKKTFKKRFCCFSSGFCGHRDLEASRSSND